MTDCLRNPFPTNEENYFSTGYYTWLERIKKVVSMSFST